MSNKEGSSRDQGGHGFQIFTLTLSCNIFLVLLSSPFQTGFKCELRLSLSSTMKTTTPASTSKKNIFAERYCIVK